MTTTSPTPPPLLPIRDLASSNPTLRRAALSTTLAHLSTTHIMTPTSSLQIWKGLFYCLYMHDSKSPKSVYELITTLAGTISSVPEGVRGVWTEGFWETMAREWAGVDGLRMEKVLRLVRVGVREVLGLVVVGEGGVGGREEQMRLLRKWPLSVRERRVPDGLRYHVLDVWVDELEGVVEGVGDGEERGDGTREAVEGLMCLVEGLSREGLMKGVRVRAKDVLSDERVKMWMGRDEEGVTDAEVLRKDGHEGEEEWVGLD